MNQLKTLFPKVVAALLFVIVVFPTETWAQTTYGLKVCDTEVTNLNKGNILKDDEINDNKVSFNPETKTLTLNGAALTKGIVWSDANDLTIRIIGDNSITNTNGTCIAYNGNAETIKFEKGSSDTACTLDLSSAVGSNVYNSSNLSSLNLELPGLCWSQIEDSNGKFSKATVSSPLAVGDGKTAETAYVISNQEDLKKLSTAVNEAFLITKGLFFKLGDSFSCSGLNDYTPIGHSDNPFQGTFDGAGNTISNLTCTTASGDMHIGLFGQIGEDDGQGTVKNLTLSNCTFQGGTNCGAIAGYLVSGNITNCTVDGVTVTTATGMTETARVGGIVGYHSGSGSITSCTVKNGSEIKAHGSSSYAGAITGGNYVSTDYYTSNYYYNDVKTSTKEGTTDVVVKSGQTQRGFGNGNDELGKVQLYGVKKVTISVPDALGNNECLPVDGTYYVFNYPDIYVLPGSVLKYSMKPGNGYKPVFTLSDNTIVVTPVEKTSSGAYDHTEFEFTMPDADLTATLSFNRILKVGADGDVQFADGQTWASLYTNGESLLLPEGLMAYIVTAVNSTSATLSPINCVPKGVPVFLENGSTVTTTNTSATGNLLQGTSSAMAVSSISGTVYALHNNKLMKVTSGDIPAGRAYLVVDGVQAVDGVNAARQLSMIIDGEGTTGIENGTLNTENSDGQETDAWFMLDGRRLQQEPAKSGLYIKNGNKVVVNK